VTAAAGDETTGRIAEDKLTGQAIHGGVNVVASAILLLLRLDVRRRGLGADPVDPAARQRPAVEMWGNLVVFALCVPARYLFGAWGALVLVLLGPTGRLGRLMDRFRRAGSA
jgi:hypothetical protein